MEEESVGRAHERAASSGLRLKGLRGAEAPLFHIIKKGNTANAEPILKFHLALPSCFSISSIQKF